MFAAFQGDRGEGSLERSGEQATELHHRLTQVVIEAPAEAPTIAIRQLGEGPGQVGQNAAAPPREDHRHEVTEPTAQPGRDRAGQTTQRGGDAPKA